MLGDTAEAETAFHVYTSAVDALYEAFAPMIEQKLVWMRPSGAMTFKSPSQ